MLLQFQICNICDESIKKMFIKNGFYLLTLLLFSTFCTKAQIPLSDSTLAEPYIPPLFSIVNKNGINLNNNLINDDAFTLFTHGYVLEKARRPVFVNEERQMIDGTYWRTNSELNYGRMFTIFGGILAVDMIAYLYQRDVWYKEPTREFHTVEFDKDMRSWQFMDKIGHFTDAYFVSDLTSKLYRWAGFSGYSSVWYGALTGFLWTLQIEISDGFMKGWGWSWGDMIFNTLGSGFFVLQQYFYDELGGIHPKVSWQKSDAWKEGRYYRTITAPIEDYEGITFWLSVNPHHYFPKSWKKSYPEWLAPLGIAVGYSAKEVASNIRGGYHEVFIGLDLDLRKIPIGDDSGLFKFIKSELNFLRLPMPTVRVYPSGIWYGFYF
jgi:hypothetical protein